MGHLPEPQSKEWTPALILLTIEGMWTGVRIARGVFLLALGLLATGSTAANETEASAPALDARYTDWLEMVEVMITEEEKTYFLSLTLDFRRNAFIEEFW